jgi:signal transduction histidine kinase
LGSEAILACKRKLIIQGGYGVMNILIVDDEIDHIESLRRGLRQKGHSVLQADSASNALHILDDHGNDINLVITDYSMPGMDGIELLENVRKNFGNLPVIIMTAYGRKDLVIQALRKRCDGYIEKPFTLIQLTQEIERVKGSSVKNAVSDELNRSVSMLLHQINNPLMAISGTAEMALYSVNDPEAVKEHLAIILAASEKIRRINQEILQTGRQRNPKLGTVDVSSVLNGCLSMFKCILELKNVSLEKQISPEGYVWGDRFGLEQMFKNLILNSIDAMDFGARKQLRVVLSVCEGSPSLSVTIEDTGCGIPEEVLGEIFKPYFTRKIQGTGLGLAVVKKVAEAHNGEVRVESHVGKGSRFTVVLPAISRDCPASGPGKEENSH